jgi:hypothetical protein
LWRQTHYAAANDVLLCSDHSPVFATFDLSALNQRCGPAPAPVPVRLESVTLMATVGDGAPQEEQELVRAAVRPRVVRTGEYFFC